MDKKLLFVLLFTIFVISKSMAQVPLALDTLNKNIPANPVAQIANDSEREKSIEPAHILKNQVRPVDTKIAFFPTLISKKYKIPYHWVENAYDRILFTKMKDKIYNDSRVDLAIKTLLDYAENDSLQNMLSYLQKKIKKTTHLDKSLRRLKYKMKDKTSRISIKGNELNEEVSTLYNFIVNSENYNWLKKISRDSIKLELLNYANDSVNFWINNDKEQFHRFWAKTQTLDSIGTWIQALPGSNKIKILLDDNVYQNRDLENYQGETFEEKVENQTLSSMYSFVKPDIGELKRRRWSIFSELEGNFGQAAMSNWALGGENSFSVRFDYRQNFDYNYKKISWENDIYYRLGFLKSGSQKIRKNEDFLDMKSKLGIKAQKNWFYTALLRFETQFFESYTYNDKNEGTLISDILSPSILSLSIGMDYKPSSDFSIFASPIAGKWTYVMRAPDDVNPKRFGVLEGKKSRVDGGARIEVHNRFKLYKAVNIRSDLNMYASYFDKEHPFMFDWKIKADFRINYFIQTSLFVNFLYDLSSSKKLQIKENLNLGVSFRF